MSLPSELLTGLDHKAIIGYVNGMVHCPLCDIDAVTSAASAMALQVYDFFQTLELEVKYIWSTRWTPLKALYLFMKYLPFADVSLILIRDNAYMRASTCRAVNLAIGLLFYLGIGAAEIVLTLRTWVLYDRPLWLTCVLCVVNAFMWIYEAIELGSIMNAVQFIDAAAQPPFSSKCLPSVNNPGLLQNWLIPVLYDVFLCILLIIRACVELRHRRMPRPIYLIYRDGIMYYLYFLFLMLLLLFFKLGLQDDVLMSTTVMGRVLYPLLATRVILHAQQQVHHVSLDDTNVVSTIEF